MGGMEAGERVMWKTTLNTPIRVNQVRTSSRCKSTKVCGEYHHHCNETGNKASADWGQHITHKNLEAPGVVNSTLTMTPAASCEVGDEHMPWADQSHTIAMRSLTT